MSQSLPHLIPARAVEDIIQLKKYHEKIPKVIESAKLYDKIEDEDRHFSKHNPCTIFADNIFCLPKVIEGNIVKSSDLKFQKPTERLGSEGDHQNSELVYSEDVKQIEKLDSEFELESWPSESDITVVRIKKEYRNELLTKVAWEEERNLSERVSAIDFDWESHSLINLAKITNKDQENSEKLTPFTIWSKTGECQNKSKFKGQNSGYSEHDADDSNVGLMTQPKGKILQLSKVLKTHSKSIHFKKNRVSAETVITNNIEILPVTNVEMDILEKVESHLPEESSQNLRKISNLSSGNKSYHSGKVKLIRSFLNFFKKCGSNKTLLKANH